MQVDRHRCLLASLSPGGIRTVYNGVGCISRALVEPVNVGGQGAYCFNQDWAKASRRRGRAQHRSSRRARLWDRPSALGRGTRAHSRARSERLHPSSCFSCPPPRRSLLGYTIRTHTTTLLLNYTFVSAQASLYRLMHSDHPASQSANLVQTRYPRSLGDPTKPLDAHETSALAFERVVGPTSLVKFDGRRAWGYPPVLSWYPLRSGRRGFVRHTVGLRGCR